MSAPSTPPAPPAPAPAPAEPPVAPGQFRRRLRLGAQECIGIPLLALLPALALAGLLGPGSARLQASSAADAGPVVLSVDYPQRLRHKGDTTLLIEVRNTGRATLAGLSIGVDEDYLARFLVTSALPAVPAVSSGGRLGFALPPLRGGDSTRLQIRLEADGWGRHPGWVDLREQDGPALIALRLATAVLP